VVTGEKLLPLIVTVLLNVPLWFWGISTRKVTVVDAPAARLPILFQIS
jgi:hypothetical protein